MAFDKDTLSKITDFTVPYSDKKDMFKLSQKNILNYLKNGDCVKCSVKSRDGKIDLGILVNDIVQ